MIVGKKRDFEESFQYEVVFAFMRHLDSQASVSFPPCPLNQLRKTAPTGTLCEPRVIIEVIALQLTQQSCCRTVSIPFEKERQAATALRVISVDKILRSDTVSRDLRVDGSLLIA